MKKNAPNLTKPNLAKTNLDKSATPGSPRTLAIDIGGTGIKSIVLDPKGTPITERLRLPTPAKATPGKVLDVIVELGDRQGDFDRVSVGFPGVVKDGLVYSAANLGKGWDGFDLAAALQKKFKRPVRVTNDADIQGLGCVTGEGLELVITLGTGFGSVLFADGRRIHLEVGHHPFHEGRTYEDELGVRALEAKGRKKWNKRLLEALADLKRTFIYDRLYIGGGNAKYIKFKLPPDVEVVSNEDGLLGGIRLWDEAPPRPSMRRKSAPVATVAPPSAPPQAVPAKESIAPAVTH